MELANLHDTISRSMFGRIGMTPDETALLGECVQGSAVHLEIGTLWGGTAILAALAGAARVYSIDKMSGGWWDAGQDPKVNHPLGPKATIDNLVRFQLQNRVTLVIALSNPFPLAGLTFTSALLDGGHTYAELKADWENVHPLVDGPLLFHDCADTHPGVMQFVTSGQIERDGWHLLTQVGTLRAYVKNAEVSHVPVSDDHHADDPAPDGVSSSEPAKPRRTKRS